MKSATFLCLLLYPLVGMSQSTLDSFLSAEGYESLRTEPIEEVSWQDFGKKVKGISSCVFRGDSLILKQPDGIYTLLTANYKIVKFLVKECPESQGGEVMVCELYAPGSPTGLAASFVTVLVITQQYSSASFESCGNNITLYHQEGNIYVLLYDFDYEYRHFIECCRALRFFLVNVDDFTRRDFDKVLLQSCRNGRDYLLDPVSNGPYEYYEKTAKMGCQ